MKRVCDFCGERIRLLKKTCKHGCCHAGCCWDSGPGRCVL